MNDPEVIDISSLGSSKEIKFRGPDKSSLHLNYNQRSM